MNQAELIKLMEQWQDTNPTIYKTNIKAICDSKGVKPRHIEEGLGVSYNSARSYTNAAHSARIEFLTALKLAEMLGVKVEEFLKENEN
jgi:transcriptional regulator with XRE-family HTH domain